MLQTNSFYICIYEKQSNKQVIKKKNKLWPDSNKQAFAFHYLFQPMSHRTVNIDYLNAKSVLYWNEYLKFIPVE